MKRTILVINPSSVNIIKAVYNALVTNLLDIIIIGDHLVITELCEKVNLNINLLQIIECNDKNEINQKLINYQKNNLIEGMIIDNFDYKSIMRKDYHYICTMIDFAIFKQSVFIINNYKTSNLIKKISETISLINNLSIDYIKIGIIALNRDKALYRRKQIKKELGIKTVDIINIEKIKKCKYNIIIFEDKYLENEYIKQIKEMILPRIIEIKKTSNLYIFDAKQTSFKNIFFQLVFLSKVDLTNNKINSQIV